MLDIDLKNSTDQEIYTELMKMTKEMASEKTKTDDKKKLYYISAEFLIGKLLSNNLINLGIYDTIKEELANAGRDLAN